MRKAVTAARLGGASRIELCSAMDLDGLTPPRSHVRSAREAWADQPGIMIMIRLHAGGFVYSESDVERMCERISQTRTDGADGVVFGALRSDDGRVDSDATALLTEAAHEAGLRVTFHRAFDATPDPVEALETLLALGVDRILTSGIPWKQIGTALDGAETLRDLIHHAENRVEIVIGGGVNPKNAGQILEKVYIPDARISFHAYSGVMEGSMTRPDLVRALMEAVEQTDQ